MDKKEETLIFNHLINEQVFIKTKSGRQYSGQVKEVHDSGNGVVFISITDKYGKWCTFTASELEVVEKEVGK